MGAFKIEIVGVGGHGCDRKTKAGEKLYGRCGRYGCPDCMAFDFVQQMRQKGMLRDGDGAYSVLLDPDTEARVRAHLASNNVKPTYEATEQSPAYFEVKNPEFLPPGAASIGIREHEAYVNYPMSALFTHWPGDEKSRVVDDMLKNERKSGSF